MTPIKPTENICKNNELKSINSVDKYIIKADKAANIKKGNKSLN
jgi:hypothetical protein